MAVRPDEHVQDQTSSGIDPDGDTVVSATGWPVPEELVASHDAPATADPEAPGRRPLPFGDSGARPLLLVLLVLALLGGALLAFALLQRDDDSAPAAVSTSSEPAPLPAAPSSSPTQTTPEQIDLPDLVGTTLASARVELERLGLEVRVRRTESERPRDEVLEQTPPAGDVERSTTVVLTVSDGAAQVAVPDVRGRSARAAGQEVRQAGLVARVRLVTSGEAKGTVLTQSPPAGTQANPDTVVTLQISSGRPAVERVAVPDLVGLSASAARSRLRTLGLQATVTEVTSDEPAGTIVGQAPAAGRELRDGATVRLRVSGGPATEAVPDVVGLDLDAARSQLRALGFRVQVVEEDTLDPDEDGLVTAQDPSGGTDAEAGTTIVLTVARLG
jgi:serine/threonine-protein kinase